ncbi:MAG: acyltransferase family protein [Myxococcales bacterium]|nr:acyltransferase family protein [Myxococcales bacterium]
MDEAPGSIAPLQPWSVQNKPLRERDRLARGLGDRFVRAAEELCGEEIDARLAALPTAANEIGFDPFGFDPGTTRYVVAVASLLHRRYFRTQVHGLGSLPEGRVLVIANHSGQLPFDAVVIAAAMLLDANPPRFPRSMVEKWSAELPFVSVLFPRCGQVVGSPENARRLLEQEAALLVFPEGARGISKTFERRYQLTRFGLGFLRLALETRTPIVPVAVIGAEEQYISLGNIKPLAKLLGMPALPIIPQLLLGMPFPLPTKYHLYFGEPIRFEGDPDDDDHVIEQKVHRVRGTIQAMVNEGLKRREHIFF